MDCDWWSLGIIMYEVNELCFSSLCCLVGVFSEVASMKSPYLYATHLYHPLFIYHSISHYSYIIQYILQCLVGFTPFYAEEPVITCKKILRYTNYTICIYLDKTFT